MNSNKHFNKRQAINSLGKVLCPLKTELFFVPRFALWQLPKTQKNFSGGICSWCTWLLLKQVVFHFPSASPLGKTLFCHFHFSLMFFRVYGVEIGSEKEWSVVSLSCRTFRGTVVTKDVIQSPVRKGEGPFIYLNISRAYTGWQMQQPLADLSLLQRPLYPVMSQMALDIWALRDKTFWGELLGHLGDLWANHVFNLPNDILC